MRIRTGWVRLGVIVAVFAALAGFEARAERGASSGIESWQVESGAISIATNVAALEEDGLFILHHRNDVGLLVEAGPVIELPLQRGSTILVRPLATDGYELVGLSVRSIDEIEIHSAPGVVASGAVRTNLSDAGPVGREGAAIRSVRASIGSPGGADELPPVELAIEGLTLRAGTASNRFALTSESVALVGGVLGDGGVPLSSIMISGTFSRRDGKSNSGEFDRGEARSSVATASAGAEGTTAGVIGPDVVVSRLPSVQDYGSLCSDGSPCGEQCESCIAAFSIATHSCNIGDEPAVWIEPTNEHPVIAQNAYRLRNNQFEMIGMSWLKHGFFATAQTISECGTCTFDSTHPLFGIYLGPSCSDLYSTSLNGDQLNLGPRSEVNPHFGVFPFCKNTACEPGETETFRTWPEIENMITSRRLQIDTRDLDPTLNAGATYFVEGHYVTPDDAQIGNGNNNATVRPAAVIQNGTYTYQMVVTGDESIGDPAVRAWKQVDPEVVESSIQIPGEGLFILAAKAFPVDAAFWRYEYALQNLNSDRAGASFAIPLPDGAVVQNIGFHDIDYHSGEPYDGTDWQADVSNGRIRWATTPYATDPNANALRWSTLYNFRFETNVAPSGSLATLGLFKPGSPSEVVSATIGPISGTIDCNDNGIPDVCDLSCDGLGCEEPCGTATDCNENSVPDDCEADCNANGIADDCDLTSGESPDCNVNGIPDECDLANETSEDCDGNGIPDECGELPDTDLDGIPDCRDLCPTTSPEGSCNCPPEGECCFPDLGFCVTLPRESCLENGGVPECLVSPCRDGCLMGDWDEDGDLDLFDQAAAQVCFSGPLESGGFIAPPPQCLLRFDFDDDGDVDIIDYGSLSVDFASSEGPK